jgi:hypothetical protein
MLDRLRHHAAAHQRRRVAGRIHVVDERRHGLAREDAAEHDPAARRQRLQDQAGPRSGMEPLPVHQHAARDGALGKTSRGHVRRHARHSRLDDTVGCRAALAPEGTADDVQERIERERLLEEVECAETDDAHRGLDRAVAGNDDDRHARRLGPHALHQLDPVDVGHPHVDDGEARRRVREQLERAAPVGRLDHLEPLIGQHSAQRLPDVLLVIDHQDRLGHPSPSNASPDALQAPA